MMECDKVWSFEWVASKAYFSIIYSLSVLLILMYIFFFWDSNLIQIALSVEEEIIFMILISSRRPYFFQFRSIFSEKTVYYIIVRTDLGQLEFRRLFPPLRQQQKLKKSSDPIFQTSCFFFTFFGILKDIAISCSFNASLYIQIQLITKKLCI